MNDRLTVNMGLRWDYITEVSVRPVEKPELRENPERRARRALAGIRAPRTLASIRRRTATTGSRVSGLRTMCGATAATSFGRGWGIYYDIGYTNSNVLFAAIDATGKGFGTVFEVDNPSGIRNPDGSALQSRAADLEHRSRRTLRIRARCRCSVSSWIRGSGIPTRDRRLSAGRISCGRPLFSRSTSYATMDAI